MIGSRLIVVPPPAALRFGMGLRPLELDVLLDLALRSWLGLP